MIGAIRELSLDSKGTHVVQKAIAKFSEDKLDFIYQETFESFAELVTNNHGLCMAKKLLAMTEKEENKRKFMNLISEKALEIMQNQYGNYAITEILSNWSEKNCEDIYEAVCEKLCLLSMQKYSSNVVEKCLKQGSAQMKAKLVKEFCRAPKLESVIRNSFGNYVMQTALQQSSGDLRQELRTAIERSIPQIPDRKIRQKWESILAESGSL